MYQYFLNTKGVITEKKKILTHYAYNTGLAINPYTKSLENLKVYFSKIKYMQLCQNNFY